MTAADEKRLADWAKDNPKQANRIGVPAVLRLLDTAQARLLQTERELALTRKPTGEPQGPLSALGIDQVGILIELNNDTMKKLIAAEERASALVAQLAQADEVCYWHQMSVPMFLKDDRLPRWSHEACDRHRARARAALSSTTPKCSSPP